MSPRRRQPEYFGGTKRPPPEHGIKLHKAGTTWWGERWIAALESVLRGDSGRLARGRTYARAGRTHDLTVQQGTVHARVTGSRAEPYQVTLALTKLPDETWARAVEGMAQRAQFAAELLASEMPRAIDEVFLALGSSLFPRVRADLSTTCSCPDWGDPCKHVAATHYVLGEALDRDPFLLFELRGRTKERVLAELRSARSGSGATPAAIDGSAPDAGAPHVSFEELRSRAYDGPLSALPDLHFSFEPPPVHGAVLRQLGTPAAWSSSLSPAETLLPIVQRAAASARELALKESAKAPEDAAADPGPRAGEGRSAAGAKKRR